MCKRLTVLVIAIAVVLANGALRADPSLIGWWKLNESDGTVAADSSGKGNDGTLQGDAIWVAEGYWDGAAGLDGDGDYIDCGNDPIYNVTDAVTLAAWVRTDPDFASPSWSGIIMRGGPNIDTFALYYYRGGQLLGFKLTGTTGTEWHSIAAPGFFDNEWHHAAATYDGQTKVIYLDGAALLTQAITGQIETSDGRVLLGAGRDENPPTLYLAGLLDDARIYSRGLSQAEIQAVMLDPGDTELAVDPIPADGAVDVPRGAVFAWTPGELARTHDVYLGMSFDDVNTADRSNTMGLLVSENQDANTYDPPGFLDWGQTYYWRVDEVNDAPDYAIFQGDVWSFTIEPLGYPIESVIATSNANSDPSGGPEKTIDGSGLNESDQHSIDAPDMWLGIPNPGEPVWIQYEFARVYKLHEMLVWNYNVQFELVLGFGLKDVTVEYSENGVDWTALSDVQFAQGTAQADYASNTTVAFGGVVARYVRLNVSSGYGLMDQFGLSEVRFLYIPVQASEPQPADGAADVALVDATLSWRAGREAVSHDVYLSTDPNALALIDTTTETTVDPGTLDLGAAYYWQISEVNEAEAISTWEGAIWSFSTEAYLVVEDFESYDDDENRIYDSWLDGYDAPDNGSTVGHLEAPFAEQTVVYGGGQSMPLFFDNTNGVTVSEAEFALAQDWTAHGIKALSLMFAGDAANAPGQLYLKVNGTKVVYGGAADDLKVSGWLAWTIDVSDLGGNLGNVTTLVIGIEGAGASGVVYVDDIRLYPQESEMIEPVEPDSAGLTAHYELDSDFQDSSGNGNHAEVVGDTVIASDPVRGSVASLDGLGDGILVPALGDGTSLEVTISVWMNTDIAWTGGFFAVFHNNGWDAGDIHMHISGGYFTAGVNGLAGGNLQSATMPEVDQWYSVTVTVSATEANLYVNGIQEDSRVPTAVPESFSFGEGHLGVWLNGANLERALTGQMDDVRFYDRVLSYAEVAGLAGRTPPLYKPF